MVYGLSSVVPRLLNFLLVPLYTRVLLPEEYGVLTEMYAYLGILLVMLTYGFETGYFRFATSSPQSQTVYPTVFFSLLLSSTLFISFSSLFAQPIAALMGYPANPEFIVLLSLIIGIDAFISIPYARLRLLNRPFLFASIKIISVIVNVGFNLFFLLHLPALPSHSPLTLLLPTNQLTLILLSNFIASALALLFLLLISSPTTINVSLSQLKQICIYSAPLLIAGLAGTVNESLDRIFIRHLVPEHQNPLFQLGIYGSNVKLAVLLVLFVQMYRYAAEPIFFSASSGEDAKSLYSRSMKFFVAFSLLIFLSVGLFTDILQMLVGESFREGVRVVPILLLANVFFGIYFNLSVWYKVTGRTLFSIYYIFAGALITVTLNIILIPHIGYYGAAIARLICYASMCVLCYVGSVRHYPIPYDLSRISSYFAVSLALFFAGYFLPVSSPTLSIVFRLILVLIFLIFCAYMERLTIAPHLKRIFHR